MRRVLLLCAVAGLGGAARTQAAEAKVDMELLEFLGSVGEDEGWQDYLEQKPVKPANKAVTEPAKKPPPAPPAKQPESKDDKQVKAK